MSLNQNCKDAYHFFTTFLTQPLHIGSVIPSSRFLAQAMVQDLVLKQNDGVLELGPGTGPLTKSIVQILPNKKAFLSIDREQSFIDLLKKQFPDHQFVCGEAQNMQQICATHLPYPVRVVLSALPFTLFDEALQESILQALNQVSESGTIFRTFQYAHSYNLANAKRLRDRVSELFQCEAKRTLVLRNAPPAYVVSWIKK